MQFLERAKLQTQPVQTPNMPHGMMDGRKGNMALLHTPEIVDQCVRNSISHSMPSLSKLLIYEDGPAELHGVTGFSLLPGSHLTIHTYSHPSKRFAFCDSFGKDVFHNRFYSHLKTIFEFDVESNFALVDREDGNILHSTFKRHPVATYGPHLTTLFHMQSKYNMDSSYFEYCLHALIDSIGMTKIMGPFSIEDAQYLSSIVIIAESHLAFHFDKQRDLLFIDIFSCKEFSLRKTVRALISLLPGTLVHKKCVKRGEAFYVD